MEYEESRGMPADAEIVFDVLSDVDAMERWLPTAMDVETAGPDRVHVTGGGEGFRYDTEGLFRAQKDQLRIEWGSEGPDYAGWAQVYHSGAGASEVNLHLSFLGDQPQAHDGREAEQIRRGMREALDRLAEEITHRVGDAS
jgi:uncharacterized protein YndB with AHSA1/START domain